VAFWASSSLSGQHSLAIFVAGFLVFYAGALPAYRVLMVWVYDRTGSLPVALLMRARAHGASPNQNGKLLSRRCVFEGQCASIPTQESERSYQAIMGFNHGCQDCRLEIKTSSLSMRTGLWQRAP
jgi:hypothetical protein